MYISNQAYSDTHRHRLSGTPQTVNDADHGIGPELWHGVEGKGHQSSAELDQDQPGTTREPPHGLEQLQSQSAVLLLGELSPGGVCVCVCVCVCVRARMEKQPGFFHVNYPRCRPGQADLLGYKYKTELVLDVTQCPFFCLYCTSTCTY